jgi:DNA-binding transcriptional MerR regulator
VKAPRYTRTEVIRLLRVDVQLLQLLESEQVVARRGRYSPDDLERVRVATELAHLDVNPAGVAMLLRMREQWLAERTELRSIIVALRSRLGRR